MNEEDKGLEYWEKNAEEDYRKVPISVLRYITELEKATKQVSKIDCISNVITPLKVAKKALLDINNWNEELSDKWKDCGWRAAKALKDIRKLEGNE